MKRLFLAAAALSFFAACSTTEYRTFEAKNNVFEGAGGTRSVVNGMDFWETGEPPRRFRVIGLIDDQRAGGPIPMGKLRGNVVSKARESGGEAVIQLNNRSRITGFHNGSLTTQNSSRFAVIQYID